MMSREQMGALVRQTRSILPLMAPKTFTFVEGQRSNSYQVYFLAMDDVSRATRLYYVDLPSDVLNADAPIDATLKPGHLPVVSRSEKISREEELLRERQRLYGEGLSDYQLHTGTRRLLLPMGGGLFLADCAPESESQEAGSPPVRLPLSGGGAPMDPKFSADGRLVAFVRNGDIFVCPAASFAPPPAASLPPLAGAGGGAITPTTPSLLATASAAGSDAMSYSSEPQSVLASVHTVVPLSLEGDEAMDYELAVTDVHSGRPDALVTAGVAEFIMQEEFDRYTGYWWAPRASGTTYRLLYVEVDETSVPVVHIGTMQPDGAVDDYRYPHVGEANAESTLCLAEICVGAEFTQSRVSNRVLHPSLRQRYPWHEYVVRAGWMPDAEHVWVQLLDRKQQRLELVMLPVAEFVSRELADAMDAEGATQASAALTLVTEVTNVWVNVTDIMHVLEDGKRLLWASERTGMRHLYLVSFGGPGPVTITPVTASDQWQVCELVGVDEARSLVYFTATAPTPLERHLFVTTLPAAAAAAAAAPAAPRQLTPDGLTHVVAMNDACTAFVSTYSSLTRPPTTAVFALRGTRADDMRAVPVLRLGVSVPSTFEMPPPPEVFSFQTRDGALCYGAVYKPPGFDPARQYPTIVYLYGGPHVQLVCNDYRTTAMFRPQLYARAGFVVLCVDSRGSWNRGLAFEGRLRERMGTVELLDQIDGLRALAERGFVDVARVGVTGWSYGGYLTLMALCKHNDVFKVGVSGAPVTHWEAYDTGYTERYMSLPALNPDGYREGSVITFAAQFPAQDHRLLIVHGLRDENVHFAHTAVLISALIEAGRPYDLQVFPHERHGVRSPMAALHCELAMLGYFLQYL